MFSWTSGHSRINPKQRESNSPFGTVVIAKIYVYVDTSITLYPHNTSVYRSSPPLVMSLDIVYFPALIEFQHTYSNDSGASYTDNIPENLRQWTGLRLKTMNPLQNRSGC